MTTILYRNHSHSWIKWRWCTRLLLAWGIMAWCPWLLLLDAHFFTLCLQASSISDKDYKDFLVTISESMAKKDHWSRDIPKGVCFSWWFVENNWTVVLQPFVFVSKESYAPDENQSASHSLDGNEETGTLWISDFLQTSTRGVSVFPANILQTSPSPSRRRQATGEEELLREDISSLQMIEPFSFIVALARAHYSAINKSDSFDIVPPNDRALRYLFVLYKPQRWVCIAVN